MGQVVYPAHFLVVKDAVFSGKTGSFSHLYPSKAEGG